MPLHESRPQRRVRPLRMPRGAQPRRPPTLLYGLICLLARPCFGLAYGLRIDRRAIRGIKKPVLVLCNHQSNYDFLVAAATAWPLKLNFMTTTWFYNGKMAARLLNWVGAIPKKQFVPDTGAIKSAMKVIARGDSVAIFPEGQVCYSGMNCDIDESIGKLVKKLGVTTINIKIRGNHLTWPKWYLGKGTFHGRVESTAEVLFTPEQLRDMPLDEVTQKTLAALRYDEYAWQRERHARFRPAYRPADGLPVVLHRCVACDAEFATASAGNELYCERCGYRVAINRYGLFEQRSDGPLLHADPAGWYRRQQRAMEKEAAAGKLLPATCHCALYKTVPGKHGYTRCGEGNMTLDATGLHFNGTKDGQTFQYSVLYERQTALTHSAAECAIDIPNEEGGNYGFAPDEHRRMIYTVDLYTIERRRQQAQNKSNDAPKA